MQSQQEQQKNFVSSIPAAALKRFADDLGKDGPSNKFLQINRERVHNFIEKPIEFKSYQKAPTSHRKIVIAGINKYDFENENNKNFIELQKLPEFQSTLGVRSRFGEGDGSFFDRWLNSDLTSSKYLCDKDGFPLMRFSLNDMQTGFKKQLEDFRSNKKQEKKDYFVQSYTDRRAERLEKERKEKEARQQLEENNTKQDELPAPKITTDEITEKELLSTLTEIEKTNYFGHEARSTFFDYFRHYSRQNNIHFPTQLFEEDMGNNNLIDENESNFQEYELESYYQGNNEEIERKDPVDEFIEKKNIKFAKKNSLDTSQESKKSFLAKRIKSVKSLDNLYSDLEKKGQSLEEERQVLLDQLFSYGNIVDQNKRPNSARSKYLQGVIDQKLLPQASLVIRKDLTTELNISSYGIGDILGQVFAQSLDLLPALQRLNISDNHLTDRGLVPIVNQLCACKNLKSLNLSLNKVDSDTADALHHFLLADTCQLSELIMQNANVDDLEASKFMETIAVRSTITYLDLSHNLLGSHELRISNRKTAGEAISNLLKRKDCRLKTLILSWNTIRNQSAIRLAESFKYNNTLVSLDLSFNGMNSDGGLMLGYALHFNRTLKHINLTSNNLRAREIFCILSGVKYCLSMRSLDLSDNPIGKEGARSLLAFNIIFGYRVNIHIKNCSIKFEDKTCWYDPFHPSFKNELSLSNLYDWCVAMDLLKNVSREKDYNLVSVKYFSSDSNSNEVKLNLFVPAVTESSAMKDSLSVQTNSSTRDNLSQQKSFFKMATFFGNDTQNIRTLIKETAKRVFNQFDIDESGTLDRDELIAILNELGLEHSWSLVDKLLSIYDIDNSGVIEEEEFVNFIFDIKHQFNKVTDPQSEIDASLQLLTSHMQYYYNTDEYPNLNKGVTVPNPYYPPEQGKLFIHIEKRANSSNGHLEQGLEKKTNGKKGESDLVTQYLEHSKTIRDNTTLFEYTIQATKWTINEARPLYKMMLKEYGSNIHVLLKLIPHLATPIDVRALIQEGTEFDYRQVQALKAILGHMYRIYNGLYNSFYQLNLAESNDREIFKKLLEIDTELTKTFLSDPENLRSDFKLGNTGQQGYSLESRPFICFRNCVYNRKKFLINETIASKVPEKGILSFDFISFLPKKNKTGDSSTSKSSSNGNEKELDSKNKIVISNSRLVRLLSTLGILQFYLFKHCNNSTSVMTEPILRKKLISKLNSSDKQIELGSSGKQKKLELTEILSRSITESLDYLYDQGTIARNSQNMRSFLIDINEDENKIIDNTLKKSKSLSNAESLHGIEVNEDQEDMKAVNNNTVTNRRNTSVAIDQNKQLPAKSMARRATTATSSTADLQSPKVVTFEEEKKSREEPSNSGTSNNMISTDTKSMQMYGQHIQGLIDLCIQGKQDVDINSSEMLGNELLLAGNNNSFEGMIALRILDALETLLMGRFISSAQLATLTETFPSGDTFINDYSTFRTEMIVTLFPRVIDLYNFDMVLRELTPKEIAIIIYRIGWLNIWNPFKPDGFYVLNMNRYEERQLLKLLICLHVFEGREALMITSMKGSKDSFVDTKPVPPEWYLESTFPKAGIISCRFVSTNPDLVQRRMLMTLVLPEFREDFENFDSSNTTLTDIENLLEDQDVHLSLKSN